MPATYAQALAAAHDEGNESQVEKFRPGVHPTLNLCAPQSRPPNDMDERAKRFQIAILLYPGVTALDAAGPWEVLSRMPNTDVRFVGKEVGPVMTEGGALLLVHRPVSPL